MEKGQKIQRPWEISHQTFPNKQKFKREEREGTRWRGRSVWPSAQEKQSKAKQNYSGDQFIIWSLISLLCACGFWHSVSHNNYTNTQPQTLRLRERERMGECCPPMDLFRSEPMQLVQIIIPIESAHLTVSYLGDLGLLQFKDVRPHFSLSFWFSIFCFNYGEFYVLDWFLCREQEKTLAWHCLWLEFAIGFDLWKCFCFMRFRVSVLGNTTIELFDH